MMNEAKEVGPLKDNQILPQSIIFSRSRKKGKRKSGKTFNNAFQKGLSYFASKASLKTFLVSFVYN